MEQFFIREGKKIFYTDRGTGQVVVLLHGYLETSDVWDGFGDKLSDKFRVIVPDLPGHGRSDIISEVHTMELMAGILLELILSKDISSFFLVGHSLGGYVALAFAELFPERLSGYCLFHSHPFADSPEALKKREREIKLVQGGRKDMMYPDNVAKMFADVNLDKFSVAHERSKEIAFSLTGEGIIAVLRGMIARPSRLAVLEEGKVPCLLILGAMDNYIGYKSVQSAVRLPVNARVIVLENSGHMGFVEEEERSVKVIEDFIKNLTG